MENKRLTHYFNLLEIVAENPSFDLLTTIYVFDGIENAAKMDPDLDPISWCDLHDFVDGAKRMIQKCLEETGKER